MSAASVRAPQIEKSTTNRMSSENDMTRVSDSSASAQVTNLHAGLIELVSNQEPRVSPELVIAQATQSLEEQRRAERASTTALRQAAHQATDRRIHHMRKAARRRMIGAIAGSAVNAAGTLAGVGAEQGSLRAGMPAIGKDLGETTTGISNRRAGLADTDGELAADQAQQAQEQASDASSEAEHAQRLQDKAMQHLGDIQQQINRGREAAIRG